MTWACKYCKEDKQFYNLKWNNYNRKIDTFPKSNIIYPICTNCRDKIGGAK